MLIQKLEFPDACPSTCSYRDEFSKFGQSAICGRCPIFCCISVKYEDESFCMIDPDDYRPDWLAEWHQFFQDGTPPKLRLRRENA